MELENHSFTTERIPRQPGRNLWGTSPAMERPWAPENCEDQFIQLLTNKNL